MKLYCSANSPYARKPRVMALELGITDRIELIDTNPRDPAGGFWKTNPLGKIPALETDDGTVLFDSPVICDYLAEEFGDRRLVAGDGRTAWQARTLAALADGIMDAAMLVRLELMRPGSERSPADMAKQMATADRGFDRLETLLGGCDGTPDLGTIAAGCCIDWVMFRHPDTDWLGPRPSLAAWQERFAKRDSMRHTAPGRHLSWTGD